MYKFPFRSGWLHRTIRARIGAYNMTRYVHVDVMMMVIRPSISFYHF